MAHRDRDRDFRRQRLGPDASSEHAAAADPLVAAAGLTPLPRSSPMCRLTAALPLIAIAILPACTTYITQIQEQEGGEEDASSFPPDAYPDADDSTTGEDIEGSTSTGDAPADTTSDSTTGSLDAGSTSAAATSTGNDSSTSTGEESSTGADDSTSSDGTSTGEQPIDETTGGDSTTGEPEPPPVPLTKTGQICAADEECASGWCSGSPIENEMRCTDYCDPTDALSCRDLGHPGLCLTAGADTFACVGWGLQPAKSTFGMLPPLPPGWDYTKVSVVMGKWDVVNPDLRAAILLPASDTEFRLELSGLMGQGKGSVIADLYSHSGGFIATHEFIDDNGTYSYPQSIIPPNHHHWLVLRHPQGVNASYTHIYSHPSP